MHIPEAITNQATADVIEGARSQARLTQQQLADRAEIPLVTVQKLLKGKQSWKINQFQRLAEATGQTSGGLMGRVTELAKQMSATESNVTVLHGRDMTPKQLDDYRGKKAADDFNERSDQPEE